MRTQGWEAGYQHRTDSGLQGEQAEIMAHRHKAAAIHAFLIG